MTKKRKLEILTELKQEVSVQWVSFLCNNLSRITTYESLDEYEEILALLKESAKETEGFLGGYIWWAHSERKVRLETIELAINKLQEQSS
jgi:hypothetical protein